MTARQRLESQQQENKNVKNVSKSSHLPSPPEPLKPHLKALLNLITFLFKEFSNLADDANIYKLVGPVLLKQDTSEAKSTVDGRLDFIDKEMYVLPKLYPLTRDICEGDERKW